MRNEKDDAILTTATLNEPVFSNTPKKNRKPKKSLFRRLMDDRKRDKLRRRENMSLSRKISRIILLISGSSLFLSLALFPIRNSRTNELATRFVRNNDVIKSEVGEITEIKDYLKYQSDARYAEMRRRLQNGESLVNLDKPIDKNRVTYGGDGSQTTEKVIVYGSKKTLTVTIYLNRHNFSDNQTSYHYTIYKARITDENGNSKDTTVGWIENYLLLFSKNG